MRLSHILYLFGIAAAQCPPSWTYVPPKCYKLVGPTDDWLAADAACASDGGHLASVVNADEASVVLNGCQSEGATNPYWIGLNDLANEGTWAWRNGESTAYILANNFWTSGQPDNYLGQNCVAVITGGKLDDRACIRSYPACCAFVPSPTPTPSRTPSKSTTPSRTPSRSITPSNSKTTSPSPSPGWDLLADQETDFSSTQGSNGWTWGYYYGESSTRTLYSPSEYNGSANQFLYAGGSWCRIGSGFMHPNTGGTCSTPSYGLCKPSAIWTNPEVAVRPQYKITFTGYNAHGCDDGIIISLKVNDATAFTDSNTAGGPLNSAHTIITEEVPQTIELISDPYNTCNCDGLTFTLKVFGQPVASSPTPTPTISDSPSLSPSSSISPSSTISATVSGSQTPSLTVSGTRSVSPTTSSSPTMSPTGTLGSQAPLTPFICSGTQVVNNGIIYRTTASGQQYPDNFFCQTTVNAPPGRIVRLTFDEFAMEACCDFVTIYDGATTAAPQIFRASGFSVPAGIYDSTGQAMTITFQTDYSIVSTGAAARIGYADPSPTPTASTTATASRSPTASASQTRTISATLTISSTASATRTISGSVSGSATRSATASRSTTASASTSPSTSATPSNSPSASASPSNSPTASASTSNTVSPSASPSNSPSGTVSPSNSPSSSASNTATNTASISMSPTNTPGKSFSVSATQSLTQSPSSTSSASSSATVSNSATNSATNSASQTATPTLSITQVSTITPSSSNQPTKSASATLTRTHTRSPTNSWTPNRSKSPTASRSSSQSPSATRSSSRSISASRTPSKSRTSSRSATSTPLPTITSSPSTTTSPSQTSTISGSVSASQSASATSSITITGSQTITSSLTASATQTQSASASTSSTNTLTVSSSQTPTASASVSTSSSSTASASQTETATISETATTSVSASQTQTPSPSFTSSTSTSPSSSMSSSATITTSATSTASSSISTSATPSYTASASLTSSLSRPPSPSPTMKSVVDLLNVLPLDGFTSQAINDVLAGFAAAANPPPLDRLAAGYFATNPNATSATFKSGNLTVELARFDPTEPLKVAAAEIPPIPGAPVDAVAFCAVKPFDASVAAASNLTGASTSVGISGSDGVAVLVRDLAVPVKVSIPGVNASTSECVYYNTTSKSWETDGCSTIIVDGVATCQCNHMTEFGMRFKAIADTNKGIFESLGKLGTLEGILAALPVILLLGSLGASLIGTIIMLYRLDMAAFRKYANLLDSSAEFELLRERVGDSIGTKSWDQLNKQARTLALRPGLSVPVPPTIPTRWYHLLPLWLKRMPYQHPWLSLIFRFDPQMPRIYRGILITANILTSVALSILFYGYSNGSVGSGPIGEPTIIETVVLSLITTATSLPISKFLFYLSTKAGELEFSARYVQLNVELTKIKNFLQITQSVPRHLLLQELDRLEKQTFGKTLAQNSLHIVEDIYAEPGLDMGSSTQPTQQANMDAAAAISGALDGDAETSVIVSLLYGLFCCRRSGTLDRFRTRLRSFIRHYAHVHTFKSRGGGLCGPSWLPIHTPLSALNTLGLFIWMGGCATYILGFTSYQSSSVALSIFKSVAISLATSNLIVAPATHVISLLMPYLHYRREGPEEAIFYPLEIFLYKAQVEFVAQASLSCCLRDQAAKAIIVASPTTLMKKVELELGEESLRIESRVQNLFWAID